MAMIALEVLITRFANIAVGISVELLIEEIDGICFINLYWY